MDDKAAAQPLTDRDRSLTMIGILSVMLLAALDQLIVTPAMPTIGGDLGDPQYLPWIVTAYLLTATAVAPLYGKLSDIHGRRPVLYVALGLFLLGSLVAALAPNMLTLIGARALQGLGGGGLFALSQIVIGDLLPPRERGRYAAWISGVWAIASIAGPLLGGALAEYYWPLIFWLNIPLVLLALVIVDRPLRKLATVKHVHQLDSLGAVLLIAGTAALLLLLNWGGSSYTWTSPEILGLGGIAVLFAIGFGIRLSRAEEPLVSLEILSNPIVLAGCSAMFAVAAANVGLAVYLPVYAETYLGLSPGQAGLVLLGFLLGTVFGSMLAGRLTLRVVHIKRLAAIGAAISGCALVATGLLAAQTSVPVLQTLLLLVGVGMGMTFPVTTVSVQNGVDQKHLGVATGMLVFLRSLGSALGVAVLGAIALGFGIPLGAAEGAPIARVSDPLPFEVLYFTMAAMMLIAALINAFMPHKPLRGRAVADSVE